jgi:hypothetical protein
VSVQNEQIQDDNVVKFPFTSAAPLHVKWEEARPLPNKLHSVLPFDNDFLPEGIRAWVKDISERMQCPPDFVGVSAMVALGAVLGRKIAIRPKEKDDWMEVPNLWGAIIGRPGILKTPAMNEALDMVKRLQVAADQKHKKELEDVGVAGKIMAFRNKSKEKDLKRKFDDDPNYKPTEEELKIIAGEGDVKVTILHR